MKIVVLSLAVQDIKLGQQFYEQLQPQLGDYFLDTLFSDIDSLILYAGVHPQFFGYFRALSKRFPYAIYYKLNGENIEVWRVLDCRQNPKRITSALKQNN
jgi:plasmid stabilization system protein ParE